jgi:hypothetical protein
VRRKYMVFLLLLVLLAALCVSGAGCGDKQEPAGESTVEVTGETAGITADPARTVTMNGRSVMGGWMEHWGYDWSGPVEENGYFFDYRELDASELDNMSSSFASNVEGLSPGSVVFFKFCFADFYGDNLGQLERIIDSVIDTAREKGLRLIIGNALPVRKQDGSAAQVSEYEKYNAYLERKAGENPQVWIYDFYGVLAGPDGFLKAGYDTGDSHPNGEAYSALDVTFFPLLERVFSE